MKFSTLLYTCQYNYVKIHPTCSAKTGIYWSQRATNFIAFPVCSLLPNVIGACTGPIAGIRQLHMDIDEPDQTHGTAAVNRGICMWSVVTSRRWAGNILSKLNLCVIIECLQYMEQLLLKILITENKSYFVCT